MKQEDAHKGMLAVNENIGIVVPQTGGERNHSRTAKICVCGQGGLHIRCTSGTPKGGDQRMMRSWTQFRSGAARTKNL